MTTRPSKLSLWLGLTRPKTLPSALASIIVAVSYAYGLIGEEISWGLVAMLGLIAISAQIGSNIANDLIDHRKGADTLERTGPMRPLTHGYISEREVVVGLVICLGVLLASGLVVMVLTSWWLAVVGLAIVLGLLAYSGGPFPLSYNSLGEVAVLVFFGWVPVVTSVYVLTGTLWDSTLWHLATSIGLASVNILIVNNYRDYEEDRKAGKRTLIVRLGRDFAPRLYLSCVLLSCLLLYPIYSSLGIFVLLIYGGSALRTYKELTTREGSALNHTLARTAQNAALLAIAIAVMLWLK